MTTEITAVYVQNLVAEAKSLRGSYLKNETDKILLDIKNNALIGKDSLWLNDKLDIVIVDRLKALGFNVVINNNSFMNDCSTDISWSVE
jgi:hypothetical protein